MAILKVVLNAEGGDQGYVRNGWGTNKYSADLSCSRWSARCHWYEELYGAI